MFTVPQFIDVEDKIIGPVTTRQFIICLVGLGFLVPAWKLLSLGAFIIVTLFDLVIFGAFAFVKINGRPFHYFVLNIVQTAKKPRLRVWNHKNYLKDLLAEDELGEENQQVTAPVTAKARPVSSHLKELALIVDTKGVYKGEEKEEII
ncbi:MAG TPA: PrgI family protein [Candidatus Methylomirabilis sp.]|nr:PrgI family protein [Candidatus Methylomirabilis sp.]